MNIHFLQNRYIKIAEDNAQIALVATDVALDVSIDFYRLLLQELQVYSLREKSFCRIGRDYDGGYIMVDDFRGGIAYSFGINTDVSWEEDIANRGYNLYMYDHTIDSLPYERPEFHWFKQGLADVEGQEPTLHFLDWYLWKNNNMQEEHMLLKMDVEGAEWGGLEQVNSLLLQQFDQIVLEVHDIIKAHTDQKRVQILSVLHKLNQTHYLVHAHGNNYSGAISIGGQLIPNALELTFVNKKLVSIDENAVVKLPRDLDQPNDPDCPEYILGVMKFNLC